jgi:hypothetical protein
VIRGGYGLIYTNSLSAAFGQGNGAFSTMGSYVPVGTPVTDPYPRYVEMGGWTLSGGAPSIEFLDLSANRTNQEQFVGTQTNIYGFMKGNKDPYIQQWNFSLQRELPGNILISAAYVGSHGSHWRMNSNTNQVPKSARVRSHINDYTCCRSLLRDLRGLRSVGPAGNDHTICSGWYALAPTRSGGRPGLLTRTDQQVPLSQLRVRRIFPRLHPQPRPLFQEHRQCGAGRAGCQYVWPIHAGQPRRGTHCAHSRRSGRRCGGWIPSYGT